MAMADNNAGGRQWPGRARLLTSRRVGFAHRHRKQCEDAMYVLEARDLKKSFGEGEAAVEALRGVNLGVQAGEMLAIMGRSGSGKSTLLTILGGVDVPTSGQILLEQNDLAHMSDDERTLVRRR